MKVSNMSITVATRWCYDYESILTCRCVQGGTPIMQVMFGADWTMYAELTANSCFMAFYDIWAPRHGNILWWKRNLLITFNHKGLKMVLTKFKVDRAKSVGGVRQSIAPWFSLKFCTKFKISDFLLTEEQRPQRLFCSTWCYTCLLNFIHVGIT